MCLSVCVSVLCNPPLELEETFSGRLVYPPGCLEVGGCSGKNQVLGLRGILPRFLKGYFGRRHLHSLSFSWVLGYIYNASRLSVVSFNPRERQQECVCAVMIPKFVPVKRSHAQKLCLRLQNENIKLGTD